MNRACSALVCVACIAAAACGGSTTSPSSLDATSTFSLSGRVADGSSGAGVSGATVAIASGPDAGKSAATDGAGDYSFAGLQRANVSVDASKDGYVTQSKTVELTTNQTLSFQLAKNQASDATPTPPTPAPTPTPTPTPPTPTPTPPTPTAPTVAAGIVTFGGLTVDRAPFASYMESGFTVTTTSASWVGSTNYGDPAPAIVFNADAGSTVTGTARVTADGSVFNFYAVDVYSSVTPIPYTITGVRNSTPVFVLNGTVPNTFGAFARVSNPNTSIQIDALTIALTNAVPGCCSNPMGLDTIAFAPPPPPPAPAPGPPPPAPPPPAPPPTYTLTGFVRDGGTGAGIGGTVRIIDGSNAGKQTPSDGTTGRYTLAGLQAGTGTVEASATGYLTQTKSATISSDQSLSFDMVPQPAPPPTSFTIGFDGLQSGTAVSQYLSPSGLLASTTSAQWTAVGLGTPAPAIEFVAQGGTTVTGEVRITGGVFSFSSVDLYSSTTKIPYTITGYRNSATVFTVAGTLPNTFGSFRTVTNPNSTASIDTLSIVLTDAAAICCSNPMGLDTIVVVK